MIDAKALKDAVAQAARTARATTPLVGSVTNTVTNAFVANAQLAVGGSAAMIYLPDEAESLARRGGAMYINVGTCLPIYEETLPRASAVLSELGRPWVLDPVGIGSGALRTSMLAHFKAHRPTVIRGNASEIIALAELWELELSEGVAACVRGVDATQEVDEARSAAVALARYTGGAVAVSGAVDLVTDGATVARSHGGSPLMTRITGSGCSLGGVCAVYAACAASPFVAALTAVNAFNLAGERAAAAADAPASFQVAFLDELYRDAPEDVADVAIELEEA